MTCTHAMTTIALDNTVPTDREAFRVAPDGCLLVPNRPIISRIEGDRIGIDLSPVTARG